MIGTCASRAASTTSTPRKPPSTSRCSRRNATRGAARHGAEASPDFMRAAHTLCEHLAHRRLHPLADLAGALEQWTGCAARDQGRTRTDAAATRETVQAAVAEPAASWCEVRSGERQTRRPINPQCRDADHAARADRRAWSRRGSPALAPIAACRLPRRPRCRRPTGARSARMHDDIDAQLLPIFLEEAQQIVPDDRRRPARVEGEPGRREDHAVAAPPAAYPEGQRAHGGRDPPRRALPPDGKPHRIGARGGPSAPASSSSTSKSAWTG